MRQSKFRNESSFYNFFFGYSHCTHCVDPGNSQTAGHSSYDKRRVRPKEVKGIPPFCSHKKDLSTSMRFHPLKKEIHVMYFEATTEIVNNRRGGRGGGLGDTLSVPPLNPPVCFLCCSFNCKMYSTVQIPNNWYANKINTDLVLCILLYKQT